MGSCQISAAERTVFRAGAATSNITPDIGSDLAGGFGPAPSRGVHDDLHARCLVMDDGATQIALVVCDLLAIHRSISVEARRLIESECGIPPANVLISATHTHSAASAMGGIAQGADSDDKSREMRSSWFEAEVSLDPYQRFVARRIADGVRRAANLRRPAQIAFGKAEAPEFAFNRRWIMRPGSIPPNPFGGIDTAKQSPRFQDPGLIRPAGEIDPTISFIALREPEGRLISIFAAFSIHYVGYKVGSGSGGEISADYYGLFCEALRRMQPSEDPDRPFVAIMANGTSGDKTPWNRRSAAPVEQPYAGMRRVAEALATKVQAALRDVSWKTEAPLAATYRELEVAWRQIAPETRAWATKISGLPPSAALSIQQKSYAKKVQILAAKQEPARVPLQVLRIGDIGIGTYACEIFAEIGLEFKRRSAIPHSFMVSLNHGYYGYLPTPRHYELGGYETWPGTSYLATQASVKMMDALLSMAGELKHREAGR